MKARKFHYVSNPVPVTISCGIAELRDGDSASKVFERADKAMCSAKQSGRNKVVLQGWILSPDTVKQVYKLPITLPGPCNPIPVKTEF